MIGVSEGDRVWLEGGSNLPVCRVCSGPMPYGTSGETHPPHSLIPGMFTCNHVEIRR